MHNGTPNILDAPYGTILAFTWVPNPHIFTGILPIYQLNDTMPLINQLNLCCRRYEMYPELTEEGNIHYHGVIVLRDEVKWHKKVLPSLKYNGFVKLKEKDKYNVDSVWTSYMSKDKVKMEKILNVKLPFVEKYIVVPPVPKNLDSYLLDQI